LVQSGFRSFFALAIDLDASEQLDQLQSLDIRDPSVHNPGRTWVTDYLITCVSNRNVALSLGVFVGSNEYVCSDSCMVQAEVHSRGDIALLSNANLSVPDAPWYLHNIWTNGHLGVVRSLLWDEEVSLSEARCKRADNDDTEQCSRHRGGRQ
jgi:hypothetical protein